MKPRKQSFAKLQKTWYGKLKKLGFKDIENGQDLNKLNASTLPSLHCSLESIREPGAGDSFSDHSKAERWRIITHGLNRLVELIKIYVDTGNMSEAGRAVDLDKETARTMIAKLLTMIGLERYIPMSTRRPVQTEYYEPAPVRTLSKDEISKLDLKPPSQIKENSEHVIPIHDTED